MTKKNKMSYGKYKGYDWGEICKPLGIKVPKKAYSTIDGDYKYVQAWLIKHGWSKSGEPRKKVIKECRAFLNALLWSKDYYRPAWKGLSKVKDDHAFLQLFIQNLPSMWN